MTKSTMANSESFTSRYKPMFDQERDEWVLQVPSSAVTRKSKDFYEVRLPVYARCQSSAINWWEHPAQFAQAIS